MRRGQLTALLVMMLAALSSPVRVSAEAKYKPCSLLTAAEVETALHGKVDSSFERDMTIPDGPFKGEIMSTCDWVVGSNTVTLNVIRGPRSQQEQAAGLATFHANEATLKQKGWTVEPGNIPGADCVSLKPPASDPSAVSGSSCVMVAKGLALWIGVNGKDSPTVREVKALADRAAARL